MDIRLRVFGLPADLRVPPERADALRRQWSRCLPDSPTQRAVAPLGSEAHSPDAAPDVEPIIVTRAPDGDQDAHVADYRVTTTLTGAAIERRAGRYLMLHAGGVSDGEGRVAGLVAASGTGKTTATRHFCTTGHGYVTDETLIVDGRGEVLPYPKPLSIVIDPAQPYRKTQHDPGELGMAEPVAGPLRLGPLVLLDRQRVDPEDGADEGEAVDGAPLPGIRRVPLFEALAKILPQSSATPQVPGCLDVLARVAAAGGGVHELRYREITTTGPLLREAFAAAPETPFWRHVPGTWTARNGDASPYLEGSSAAEAPAAGGVPFVRTPFVDALSDEETCSALVLQGNTPVQLQGVGALVWNLCERPHTLADLVEACTAAFGAHRDGPRLVRDGVEAMLGARLLREI